MHAKLFSCAWLFVTWWTVTCQASLSMGFSRQEYWSGLPFPPPGALPDSGIKPSFLCLLHWQVGSSPLAPSGKPYIYITTCIWTEEPGGLYSPWGHKKSDTTEGLPLFVLYDIYISYVCVCVCVYAHTYIHWFPFICIILYLWWTFLPT